ncbi:2-acylglycerol O-acyltransferase 2-like [Adelges cooleyi]|uniref:2-acylglycerol O-acyltransferase 2-like n=1 Tax=Adelges cooleyi TaxID=133065 RepID=UPI00218036D1|nr:2-acylglycerol O-acyltransferase 2-like [Adelges cooleyi]
MKIKNVEFAPLWVPLGRRLETLGMAITISMIILSSLSWIVIIPYTLLFTRYWWIVPVYIIWTIIDKDSASSGEPKYFARSKYRPLWDLYNYTSLWALYRRYLSASLIKTYDLPADKSYLFASYPHGTLGFGVFGNCFNGASPFRHLFPGLNAFMLVLGEHFKIPIGRELLINFGFRDASEKSLINILDGKKGNVAILLVGGVAEAFNSFPGPIHIIVNKRKGFVRIALKTGASIVPVFSFGEHNLYRKHEVAPNSLCHKFLKLVNWRGDRILPNGRGLLQYTFGILPRRCSIVTVVGKPIDVPKISNPTTEEINKYHEIYVTELKKLFDEHKTKYSTYPEEMNMILD